MKKLSIIAIIALTGCAGNFRKPSPPKMQKQVQALGHWSFVSMERRICAKVKGMLKCKILLRIPGKMEPCTIGAGGYLKLGKNGEYRNYVKATMRCPGMKPHTKAKLTIGRYKLANIKGKRYLLVWIKDKMYKQQVLKLSARKLQVSNVKQTYFQFYVKGKLIKVPLYIIDRETYLK